MECLVQAQHHANAIRYYFEYAGRRGYAKALDHFGHLSSIYASIGETGPPPSDVIEQMFESSQFMIEQMKKREEERELSIQKQWMYL